MVLTNKIILIVAILTIFLIPTVFAATYKVERSEVKIWQEGFDHYIRLNVSINNAFSINKVSDFTQINEKIGKFGGVEYQDIYITTHKLVDVSVDELCWYTVSYPDNKTGRVEYNRTYGCNRNFKEMQEVTEKFNPLDKQLQKNKIYTITWHTHLSHTAGEQIIDIIPKVAGVPFSEYALAQTDCNLYKNITFLNTRNPNYDEERHLINITGITCQTSNCSTEVIITDAANTTIEKETKSSDHATYIEVWLLKNQTGSSVTNPLSNYSVYYDCSSSYGVETDLITLYADGFETSTVGNLPDGWVDDHTTVATANEWAANGTQSAVTYGVAGTDPTDHIVLEASIGSATIHTWSACWDIHLDPVGGAAFGMGIKSVATDNYRGATLNVRTNNLRYGSGTNFSHYNTNETRRLCFVRNLENDVTGGMQDFDILINESAGLISKLRSAAQFEGDDTAEIFYMGGPAGTGGFIDNLDIGKGLVMNYTHRSSVVVGAEYTEPTDTATIKIEFITPLDNNASTVDDMLFQFKLIDDTGSPFEETSFLNASLWTNISGTYGFNTTNSSELLNASTINITLNDVEDGSYIYAINTSDNNGNWNMSQTADGAVMNFTFEVDTTPPTIIIIEPVNIFYNNTNVNLNWTANENINYLVYSFNGAANQSLSTNMTLDAIGGYNNITLWGNDTTGLWNSTFAEFTAGRMNFHSWSYEAINVYNSETANFSMVVNHTTNVVPVGNFSWNFTNYEADYSSVNGELTTYVKSITIPIINNFTENFTIAWNITSNFEGIAFNRTAQQTVNQYTLTNCSALSLSTTKVLEFSFLDELNLTDTNNDTLDILISVWGDNIAMNNSFSWTLNETTGFDICIFPNYATYQSEATLEYYSAVHYHRNYYLTNETLTNASANYTLYQIDKTNGEQITFTVDDAFGNLQQDVIIEARKYDLGDDSYLTVAMGKTDFDGETFIYLERNKWYKFILEQDNVVVGDYDNKLLTETSLDLSISEALLEWFDYRNQVTRSCDYSLGIISCDVIDTSTHMTSVTLEVFMLKALNFSTKICTDTATTSTAALSCNLTNILNLEHPDNITGSFYYSLSGEFSSQEFDWLLFSANIDFGMLALYGITGVFIAFILVLTLGFVGVWNPVVSIFLSIIAILVCSMLQLIVIGSGGIIGLVIAGALIVYKMKS